ncbi:MAG TPA: hypothetical protein VKQ72_07035, partial [Aggregatilineales bacterium]|nr:hypothetical protein [Aggregatilineales bacterium]
MRRTLLIFLLASLSLPLSIYAQDSGLVQHYRSDTLGLAFDYPSAWQIQEQSASRLVTVASKDDLDALKAGKAPSGLLFSIAMSDFRAMGIASADDFASYLQRAAHVGNATPAAIHVGGADGLSVEIVDDSTGIASRTALLSPDKRRVAVVRGVASSTVWTASASKLFDQILASLTFVASVRRDDLPNFGVALWQTPAGTLTDMAGIAVSPDGMTIYVTDRKQGIWRIGANGVMGDAEQISGMSAYGQIGVLMGGNSAIQFVADPTTNAIWQIALSPDGGKASVF